MGKRKKINVSKRAVLEFFYQFAVDKPLNLSWLPLIFALWAVEKWVFCVSSWVPLVLAIWATFQYGAHKRRILAEDLNRKWKRALLEASPTTPVEHCEWLNKLLMEVWLQYIHPKLSTKLSSIVERRLKHRRPKFIERIEVQEFSLGSSPPSLGLDGMHWSTLDAQKILHVSFNWDTNDMSIMLLAKLGKPLYATARIVINYLHIKGDLQLMPTLDGKAILYSFVTAPDVRIGVAFGSGGSQSLPATELPGVSSWLVKLFTDTLTKTMVEPRRRCYPLPAVQLRKKAVGGIVYVKVISASQICRYGMRGSPLKRQQNNSAEEHAIKDLKTFVEVELEELTRRTDVKPGSSPRWDSSYNMVLHEDAGVLRFHLYESSPDSVKLDYLASCEVKIKYCEDDSTTFWAIGPDSSIIAKHAMKCGDDVEMNIPFEGVSSGELSVRLILKEWQFSDGSNSSSSLHLSHQQSVNGFSNLHSSTGRKIYVTVVEARDLVAKEKSGKCEPYVKLQYGKAVHRTKAAQSTNPVWDQRFKFEEIGGGEYLKLRCLYEETFGDENIGSARVNLEGLAEGPVRDVWVPLEKVNSGDIRLKIEAVREGWIELLLVEARDLVAADLMGTSDPYVKVLYGSMKKRTKVVYKTLNPKWNQMLEFPDDGSPLLLQVKDHNAIMAASSIGECIVEYQRLPPNQMFDKWIPLQEVKKGEIHIQITRKLPELQRRPSVESDSSSVKARMITSQMKQLLIKLQSSSGDDDDPEAIATTLSELESLQDMQEEYMLQLETERSLLLDKINDLGQELLESSSPFSRSSSY